MVENWRSNVIREIAKDEALPGLEAAANPREIRGENVTVDNLDSRVILELFLQMRCQRSVEFNRHHPPRTLNQEARHGAAPRPNFDHELAPAKVQSIGDAMTIARVSEEVLAQFGPA
jgi:hypothetical protein